MTSEPRRYMVCKDCLMSVYRGSEKSCSHGWDIIKNKPLEGLCSRCGKHATSLHCPDGSILAQVEAAP